MAHLVRVKLRDGVCLRVRRTRDHAGGPKGLETSSCSVFAVSVACNEYRDVYDFGTGFLNEQVFYTWKLSLQRLLYRRLNVADVVGLPM